MKYSAGTDDHLRYSLDVPGQDLVYLMIQGYAPLFSNAEPRLVSRRQRILQQFQLAEDDHAMQQQLVNLFPGFTPPAEIRMVSPMGLATSDLLHYTSDNQFGSDSRAGTATVTGSRHQ